MFKIGVMVESFRVGLWQGLEAASKLGVDGVQLYASAGESHFAKMDGPARAKLLKTAKDLKLEFSALCGDFGGNAFHDPAENPAKVEDSKRVMEMALELECRVVTTHAGTIPADPKDERYLVMAKAFESMGRFAADHGATFAIETGPEHAGTLAMFLKDLDIPGGIGVNFDPANLVMVCREDIPQAVRTLGPWIVHTHAKDGVNLQPFNPEGLYGPAKRAGVAWGDYFKEVPLGQGKVPFPRYLKVLEEVGYQGYLTVEREVGGNPAADIAEAVGYLRGLIA
jgi:sugar phosphate isomerase/epimerase